MFFIMGSPPSFPLTAARRNEGRDLVIKNILEMFFITGSPTSFPLAAARGNKGRDLVTKNILEMDMKNE